MLRVLTLSTLFPDGSRPGFGGFVERQTLGLAEHPAVELKVVAPIGLPFGRLVGLLGSHRALADSPAREDWKGLDVVRPRFTTLPFRGGSFNPAWLYRTLARTLDRLRPEFPFDVIDAEFFYPDGPAAIELGRRYGVPVSIKARGSDIHVWGSRLNSRRQIIDTGRAAAGMLAVSEAMRRDMIALGLPAGRIHVHHTGVDRTMFHPRDRARLKAELGIEGPLVVTAGNLIPLKRQALLIEAMRELPGYLLIAGDGPEHGRLSAHIARAGLEGRVRLLGHLPHADLPRLFAAADVFALASASEGLANVWVEALACGTPIVITDVGGAREVVTSASAGRIVDSTAKAIAGGILDILGSPPGQGDVVAQVEAFSWERNRDALYAHLDGLVRRRKSIE